MRKKNTLFNSGFLALLTCLFFITSAYSQAPCTNTFITSFLPASGPAGTVVTISGTGFQLGTGTSSVKFNGTEAAAFTVVSATVIQATVPATATNGAITIITNGCVATATPFTVIATNYIAGNTSNEIYISEVYDQRDQSGGMIELYNPSNNTITFNGNYVLLRYGDINDTTPTIGYTLTLLGHIDPESTYLVACSAPLASICAAPTENTSFGNGFNGNDKLELVKNNRVIDRVEVPFTQPGFTLVRKPDAVAPTPAYNQNDWNNTLHDRNINAPLPDNNCADLGNHTTTVILPTITLQPQAASICENSQVVFSVALSHPSGFIYQWKTLNSSGSWVNVTNGINYSGATTATLSVNNVPASFNSNQYYCEMTATGGSFISNAIQLTIAPALAAVVATASATDCASQTATVTVTSTLPATGITYTLGSVTQASNVFTGVGLGLNTITVTDTNGTCPPVSGTVTVLPATGLASFVATLSATDCATQTATVTVTSTLPATGITYTLGSVTQASNVFTGVGLGLNTITVTDTNGTCPPVSGTVTVLPATVLAPFVATLLATDCATQTATVTVTSTLPATGITYTLGTLTQASNVFTGVGLGLNTITITDTNGTCLPVSGTITVLPATGLAPFVATVSATDCVTQTATVTVISTLPATGITYTLGTLTQASNIFTGVGLGPHSITVTDSNGTCLPVSGTVTIVPAATLPAVVATVSATDCATQTATVTVTSTLPATGITYTLGSLTQASNVFTGVGLGLNTITITDTNGTCLPVSGTVTVLPATGLAPLAIILSATDCNNNATINITAPVGTGILYSLDGGAPQLGTSFITTPGTHSITASFNSCTASDNNIVVNAPAPLAPITATVSATDCLSTATITVTAPSGAGMVYRLDGVIQPSNTFTTGPGPHIITASAGSFCSVSDNITVGAAPAPFQTTGIQECRETVYGRNYILQVLPVANSFDAATATFEWRRTGQTAIIADENTFNVAQYAASNNILSTDFPLQFEVTVITPEGCRSALPYTVSGIFCDIPKGISPGNDSKNDTFNLIGLNVTHLSIYNRYGLEVYTRTNYTNEWHGQQNNGNELPTGTYFYVIDTESKQQTGWVYINRREN